MIYLCISTYQEAVPFIKELSLKKQVCHHTFAIYQNDCYTLILSKSGMIHQAMAITYLFDHMPFTKDDFLIHIGMAAILHNSNMNPPFLITKIYHGEEGITYYPDILYKHPFTEATLFSASRITSDVAYDLYDDQAAAIYESALPYITIDRLIFLKLSQLDETTDITTLLSFIESLKDETTSSPSYTYTKEESELVEQVASMLFLSESQHTKLLHYLHYEKVRHGSILSCLEKFTKAIKEKGCESKREGKMYLEQFYESIINC